MTDNLDVNGVRRDLNRVRILFYIYCKGCEKVITLHDSIVRKGSYFIEIDKKFRDLGEGIDFLQEIEQPFEICIMTNDQQISYEERGDVCTVMRTGMNLITEEKYWLAHEVFEGLWKHDYMQWGRFFHGVTLLCVSMVHIQMSHESVSSRIFNNAKSELESYFGKSIDTWSHSYPLDSAIISAVENFLSPMIC